MELGFCAEFGFCSMVVDWVIHTGAKPEVATQRPLVIWSSPPLFLVMIKHPPSTASPFILIAYDYTPPPD